MSGREKQSGKRRQAIGKANICISPAFVSGFFVPYFMRLSDKLSGKRAFAETDYDCPF